MRIVSLIASATEIVGALGLADQLVGVSHECDYPLEAVEGRPILTSPKIDIHKKSLDIHKDVQKIVEQGLSVYNIDVAKLKTAKPDIIITQDQCEVCAVTFDDVVRATKECLDVEAKIVTLHPDNLDDIFVDILKVGKALEVEEKATELVEELREKMANVAFVTEKLKKPRVICLEWLNPLMIAGNWIPEMVEMAGGQNGITKKGDHTKVVSWEEIIKFDPEFILLMPCGFKIEQTFENRSDLESLPGFQQARAVHEKKIFAIDGNTYMNRPGPRILESLYILAGIFHSKQFWTFIPADSYVSFR